MEQTWHDLLFAHWPVEVERLRGVVPVELPLDTYRERAWVGVVPFWMSGIRGRFLPPLPGLSQFPELNVRTYVVRDGKPGVYFFSLDAASLPAVWTARATYRLPYFHARMRVEERDGRIRYASQRIQPPTPAVFRGVYRPVGEVELRQPGSLEHWLTERYCLYTTAEGRVYRGEIHHEPWPLQDAEATIQENSVAETAGIALPEEAPLLHFARRVRVLIWAIERICVRGRTRPSPISGKGGFSPSLNNEAPDYQSIETRAEECMNRITGRTHHRFIRVVKRSVQQHRAPRPLPELH